MFLTNFAVIGLDSDEKAEKLIEKLKSMDGVKDVKITGREWVSVTYDPSKVLPAQLAAGMGAVGIKISKG